jgi:hypothetical protein
VTPIWKQAGNKLDRQVSAASGLAFPKKREGLMFDNEIDWVTRLESRQSAVRRTRQRKFSNTYTYKAEHERESV